MLSSIFYKGSSSILSFFVVSDTKIATKSDYFSIYNSLIIYLSEEMQLKKKKKKKNNANLRLSLRNDI